MSVIISEFEVVPEEQRREAQAPPQPQQPKQSQQEAARQLEASLRTLLARRDRLRAT